MYRASNMTSPDALDSLVYKTNWSYTLAWNHHSCYLDVCERYFHLVDKIQVNQIIFNPKIWKTADGKRDLARHKTEVSSILNLNSIWNTTHLLLLFVVAGSCCWVEVGQRTGNTELDLDEELLRELSLPLYTPGNLAATKTATKYDDAPHWCGRNEI